ncbi:DUF4349 domain-containing protein [Demequina oxidasica]|uniref:DUF4349 domain-containing protein n=1 Tax=Demequina oxidasica TaxID=676199 RepID=UPI000781B36E|nr:DUF4349 domain-containing protein [Demequina oxidasica]
MTSTRTHTTSRRVRIGGTLASLVVIAGVLTGCSSSSEDSAATYEGGEAGADAAYVDESAAQAPGAEIAQAPGAENVQTSVADRSVIVTGAMYMTVEKPIAAADQAVGIVQGSGGRIDARSETAPDEGYGGSAYLTMRIPSDKLDTVVDDLRDLGTVDEFSTQSSDVTTQVTDLEAQISTLRASTARIEALLLEAEDISDIIKLEAELDSRQAELEGLEARQRGLEDQVSMSTIDLSLTTEPVVIVDDEPQNFWDALAAGWGALVTFLAGALIVLGVLLPWLVLAAIIALVVLLLIRAGRARKARRPAKAPRPQPAYARTGAPGQPWQQGQPAPYAQPAQQSQPAPQAPAQPDEAVGPDAPKPASGDSDK